MITEISGLSMYLDWGSNCNSWDVNLYLWDKLVLGVVLVATGIVSAAPQASCTTATVIDLDCDGYGVGSSLGPDADDGDPSVNTAASMIAKYDPVNRDPFAALQTFLPQRRGYHPLHYVFIAPNGEDSTCAVNNINLPCATFAKANALAVAGDAVMWRAGTYSYTNPLSGKSGTPTHPMIYMAYPGEKAILSWKVASDGVSMDAQSYWILDGLVITQTANLGAGIHYVQSNNVYSGTIVNTETMGWYDGAFLQNGLNNLTIQASAIHDSQGEHNVYVGCSNLTCPSLTVSGNLLYNTTGIHNLHLNGRFPGALIEGNTFYGAIGDCLALQMGVSGSTVQNNICHTVVSAAIWLIDYFETSDPSIGCYDQNYNLVRNNTFIDDGQSWNLTAARVPRQRFLRTKSGHPRSGAQHFRLEHFHPLVQRQLPVRTWTSADVRWVLRRRVAGHGQLAQQHSCGCRRIGAYCERRQRGPELERTGQPDEFLLWQ
jgi:hypothetical protein